MLKSFLDMADGAELRTDICIIGAGPAGIAMALELDRAGREVLLLESGGDDYDADIQSLNAGTNLGREYFDLEAARLRYLGGTSNHWNGLCMPLAREDFVPRSFLPVEGWPIDHSEVEPYHQRVSELCHLGPARFDDSMMRELDYERLDLAPEKLRFRLYQFAESPVRFGETYRDQLEASTRITTLLYATALELVPDANGGHVERLTIGHLSGRRGTVTAKQFVLACGGIENPRLLLLSDSVVAGGLGNGKDQVGRYFMEHPHVTVGHVVAEDQQDFLAATFGQYRDGVRYHPTIIASQAYQQQHGILDSSVAVRILSRPDSGVEALRAFRRSLPDDLPNDWAYKAWLVVADLDEIIAGAYRRYVKGKAAIQGVGEILLIGRLEQAPNPDSRVTLVEARDALGQRQVGLDWRLLPIDKASARQLVVAVAEDLARLDVARVRLPDWLAAPDDSWSDEMEGGWHHMGTTRMASHAGVGVVDANCQVFGIDNLFVAGSSVFSTSGHANPTYSLLALALRLADHLKDRQG